MPNRRHSSDMLVSCLAHATTNARRCSMGEVSFQATDPPEVRRIGVTHVLGLMCYPCARFVPSRGAQPLGRKPAGFRLPKKLVNLLPGPRFRVKKKTR